MKRSVRLRTKRELIVAPEVRSLLSRQTRRHLDTLTAGERRCFACGRPITPTDPAALVVFRDPQDGRLAMTTAHPTCQVSAVLDRPIDEAKSASIRWAQAVLQGPRPRAVLAVLHGRELLSLMPDGGTQDPLRQLLEEQGFQRIADPATVQLPHIDDWICRLDPSRRVTVQTRQGSVELETYGSLSQDWAQVAGSQGEIMLLEVVDAPSQDDAEPEVQRALAEGRCYAGLVKVEYQDGPNPFEHP
jgi:hypothetical protein